MGARPGAVNTSMKVLSEERARQKQQFDLALKAIEEKERIRKLREEITRRTELKKVLESERQAINNKNSRQAIIRVNSNKVEKASLW